MGRVPLGDTNGRGPGGSPGGGLGPDKVDSTGLGPLGDERPIGFETVEGIP